MAPQRCECGVADHAPRLVVVTGGPGAGKTAVLEIVRRHFCEHVAVLPESAGIVYGGGFPRRTGEVARRMGQRAIFHVQSALEDMAIEERRAAVVLCDRGTLDGLAYWPGDPVTFCRAMRTQIDEQLGRYAAVIHLRVPDEDGGYNRQNHLRGETAAEARAIDARILEAWGAHPRRTVIDNAQSFLDKASHAIEAIRREVPECCREHAVPMLRGG